MSWPFLHWLAIVLLALGVGCRSNSVSRGYHTAHMGANTIYGTQAAFLVEYEENTTHLHGLIRLRSTTSTQISFPVYEYFPLHVEVDAANGKAVNRLGGFINPIKTFVLIKPSQCVDRRFDIALNHYFELKPGIYFVKFIYDNRLIESGGRIVDWSAEKFKVRVP